MPKPRERLQLRRAEPAWRLAPRSGPPTPFAPDESSGVGTSSETLPRVLIVEDDFLVSADMEAELMDAGFTVVGIATSAKEAIELATDAEPHLVIMDIRLDGPSDGVEAALEIFKSKGIRSLFASAYHDAETRRRAEPCAPLGWVAKPYPMNALVAAVRAAMRAVGGPEPQAK
jgi:DNA-binding NarL/FixJ family response regulator